MNRGFGYYVGNSVKKSAAAVYKNKGFIKYYVYFFMELLAAATVIFGAIFAMSSVALAKIADREGKIDVARPFTSATRKGSIKTMILTVIVEALLFLAGILIIGAVAAMLALLGYLLTFAVDTGKLQLLHIILIFTAPAQIVMLIYLIVTPLLLSPTAYVIESSPDITVGEVLVACFDTMKTNGKLTLILISIITSIVPAALCGVGYLGCYLLQEFLRGQLFEIVYIVWVMLVLVAFVLVFPIFDGARRIATKQLFDDIVVGGFGGKPRTEGINIKRCKGIKIDPAEIENGLAELFDETEDTHSVTIKKKRLPALRKKAAPADKEPAVVPEPKAATSEEHVPADKEPAVETAAPAQLEREEPEIETVQYEPVEPELEPAEAVREDPARETAIPAAPESIEPATEEERTEEQE